MRRRIYVFGVPDDSTEGFRSTQELNEWIKDGVFTKEHGRFRYSQPRDPDVIVLSRDGGLYGHFEVDGRVRPTAEDVEVYSKTKWTYLVRASHHYPNVVPLFIIGDGPINWGREITEEEFESILKHSGTPHVTRRDTLPESDAGLERVRREVWARLRQSVFRKRLLSAYDRKCAISACDAEEVLEAAHLVPYSKNGTHRPSNGLLLRADLHTLFDCEMLGIDPATLTVRIAPKLMQTCYRDFAGVPLHKPVKSTAFPNAEALAERWKEFERKHE